MKKLLQIFFVSVSLISFVVIITLLAVSIPALLVLLVAKLVGII